MATDMMALERQLTGAWRRWRRLSAKPDTLGGSGGSLEAQLALLAAGIALEDEILDVVEAAMDGLLLPLPALERDEEGEAADDEEKLRFYLFKLVVAGSLIAQRLDEEDAEQVADKLLGGKLVNDVLVPVLASRRLQLMHQVALRVLGELVEAAGEPEAIISTLYTRVAVTLLESSDGRNADARFDVSYDALCSLLELLLRHGSNSEQLDVETTAICGAAIAFGGSDARFLQSVIVHLIPALLKRQTSDIKMESLAQELLSAAVTAWDAMMGEQRSKATDSTAQGLLYVICLVMPYHPRLIADIGLQRIVSCALTENDPLQRKQGLHILKVAFSHYVMLIQPAAPTASTDTDSNGKKRKKNKKTQEQDSLPRWVTTWQQFITGSEVILMHHEQHLIEQVWPHVEQLIQSSLVIMTDREKANSGGGADEWPVRMSFEWTRSLLVRVFAHENAVVKRLFLSHLMERCVQTWEEWSNHNHNDLVVDQSASFACERAFRDFVFSSVLRASNDPVLYKNSKRAIFQALLTKFLATFLQFRLEVDAFYTIDVTQRDYDLLDEFVFAIHDALFAENSDAHSPEALQSMVQVFQDKQLQLTAIRVLKDDSSKQTLLTTRAIEQLRFMMDVYVLPSFPYTICVRMLNAVHHALTGGFTAAASLDLATLARALMVFTSASLVANNGEALVNITKWLQVADNSLMKTGTAALRAFVIGSKVLGEDENSRSLSADQLARLLLFSGSVSNTPSCLSKESEQLTVAYDKPLRTLLSVSEDTVFDDNALVALVAAFEQQRVEVERKAVGDDHTASVLSASIKIVFRANLFYGSDENPVSSQRLFEAAAEISQIWHSTSENNGGNFDALVSSATASTRVMTRMAIYNMEERSDLSLIARLDTICTTFQTSVGTTSNVPTSLQLRTLSLLALSIVSSNAAALETINAFSASRIIPLLLEIDQSASHAPSALSTSEMKQRAWCLREMAGNKWFIMQNVLLASSFLPTDMLRRVYDDCLESLPTAGMKPAALLHMVNVLSVSLRRLAGPLLAAASKNIGEEGENGTITLVSMLMRELWGAYNDCKSKPDVLTRAVVYCAFQPAFLLSHVLSKDQNSIMREWIETFLSFGRVHRPNVVFHVTCRLCQVWRANPFAARWFIDEIVDLLLYKEPLVDEKEQLATSKPTADESGSSTASDIELQKTTALAANAKNRFVRLIVLSFLDELVIESNSTMIEEKIDEDDESFGNDARKLMTALLLRLLRLNVTPEWQKQHMLNSDGFGQKVRAWQALCVLGQRVSTRSLVEMHISPLLCEILPVPQLPGVRFYMEIFCMQLAVQFPRPVMDGCLLPMLRNFNLTPQVGATLLLVCGYMALKALDRLVGGSDEQEMCASLIEAMLPWLNSSHGHTRVLVQYLLGELLPRYLPYEDGQADIESKTRLDMRFLRQLALFMSENKECKRMFRRQTQQLESFQPAYEASLLGLLSSSYLNEFQELLPRDERLVFATQFRDVMNELYAQYQREYYGDMQSTVASTTPTLTAAHNEMITVSATALNVQRKIDTHPMLLLDDASLPLALQQQQKGGIGRDRQPVIMCASLVDKVPNLAGLARTCEIFNAQSLIVPTERVLKDETFATVSVTADKWMPIEEVRPELDELLAALRQWKRQGYTIVAVEQTASSQCLSAFKFPKKMVIVLGKEREGVPVEILQAVDVCVEIPQFGVIRSLNVHVSGALLLWEYTQQYMTC